MKTDQDESTICQAVLNKLKDNMIIAYRERKVSRLIHTCLSLTYVPPSPLLSLSLLIALPLPPLFLPPLSLSLPSLSIFLPPVTLSLSLSLSLTPSLPLCTSLPPLSIQE